MSWPKIRSARIRPVSSLGNPLLLAQGRLGEGGRSPAAFQTTGATTIEYGREAATTIAWDEAAAERMKKIPAFVRGMVIRAVEESCRKSGLERVTVEELERIRARMPTPKMFGRLS